MISGLIFLALSQWAPAWAVVLVCAASGLNFCRLYAGHSPGYEPDNVSILIGRLMLYCKVSKEELLAEYPQRLQLVAADSRLFAKLRRLCDQFR